MISSSATKILSIIGHGLSTGLSPLTKITKPLLNISPKSVWPTAILPASMLKIRNELKVLRESALFCTQARKINMHLKLKDCYKKLLM
jgi:hypothetical protein